jgi:hypothetical protein
MKNPFLSEFKNNTLSKDQLQKLVAGQTMNCTYTDEDGNSFTEFGECASSDCVGAGNNKYYSIGMKGDCVPSK